MWMRPQAWTLSHRSGVRNGDKDKNVLFLLAPSFPRAGDIGAVPSTMA